MGMKKIWNKASLEYRKKLLRSRGLNPSFAEVSNYDDLCGRGGGMVKHSLDKLYSEYKHMKRKIF